MHGLIFETSVWLLAESTRLLSIIFPASLRACLTQTGVRLLQWLQFVQEMVVGRSATSIKKQRLAATSTKKLRLFHLTFRPPVGVSIKGHTCFVGIRTKQYMVFHALWDMLQAAIVVPALGHKALLNNTTQSSWPAQSFRPWQNASLRQNSLGKEIKSTTAETVIANQLPQSGMRWDNIHCLPLIQSMIIFITILTDRNTRLKHCRG